MSQTVNAGARLDRLPLSAFHRRILWLIGAGMFFDGYDLYVGTTVLGSTVQSGFSTLAQNAQFVSMPFLGLTLGSLVAGFLGDRFGRRVQVAILFGVYTPELFPTEVRLRANGIVNMLGRAATVVSPLVVVGPFTSYGVGGVIGLMSALVVLQVVAVWGVEPARRSLEHLAMRARGADLPVAVRQPT